MSFLDLDEFLIELASRVDLVYSPVADIKEYPKNVDVCLMEGAICNEDNLELIHIVRARTKVLASFGDCAVTANVPAMRNQLGAGNEASVLQRAYIENARHNPCLPQEKGIVPVLLPRVMPIHEVVKVEYFLPAQRNGAKAGGNATEIWIARPGWFLILILILILISNRTQSGNHHVKTNRH
jgi:NAD-reducing hydrogenase small subunit